MRTTALLAALFVLGCEPPTEAAAPTDVAGARSALRSGRDSFGIRQLYPSASGGPTFVADFTRARTLGPGESVGDLWNRGNGTLRIVGDGTAIATGTTQRHYLGDRSEARQWRNLELTYYARRRDDYTRDELLAGGALSRAGITAEVRTGDGHHSGGSASVRCEGRAYAGSFRFYGHATLGKELQHPNYANDADPAGGSVRDNVWPSGVPHSQWIGFKLVVFNRPGEVHIELYRDLTDGLRGGTWQRVLRYVDQPGRWGISGTSTLCGLPTDRIISEPGPFVIVRNDVSEIQYKNLSVREIEASPVTGSAYVDIGDSIFVSAIRAAEMRGDLVPCNPPWNTWFCPNDDVRRDEAAAFFARALDMSPPGGNPFVDDDGNPFEDDIEAIAECGITRGCNPPTNDRFCPARTITRAQMAAFFARGFQLPAATRDYFVDDDGSIFESSIDRLAEAGITRGCNPPTNDRFCPDDPVTRGQMATFLERARGAVPPTTACVCSASTEICNALDDDCDGDVDENAAPERCGGGDDDCDGSVDENAAPEACNGMDDDCDGATDEDMQPESCNGIDDDCDGESDEGLSCAPTDGGVAEDASLPDAGARRDAGRTPPPDASALDAGGPGAISGGCGCRAAPAGRASGFGLALAMLLFVARRRGRR